MNDDFLSRWSRRKRGLPSAEKPAPAPEVLLEQGLSAEEVAALPSLDSLGPDSDMLAFLQKGVPTALRNAALRKAWALDPKIRDYVSEALDYAYDWNVPGGVPGNGPLLASDDIAGTVERLFSRSPALKSGSEELAAQQDEAELSRTQVAEAPEQLEEGINPALLIDPVRLSPPILPIVELDIASPEPKPVPLPHRRHGSARPV
jgi:Protein of unknown function (DUF3306)